VSYQYVNHSIILSTPVGSYVPTVSYRQLCTVPQAKLPSRMFRLAHRQCLIDMNNNDSSTREINPIIDKG